MKEHSRTQLTLRPMVGDELVDFLARSRAEFIETMAGIGQDPMATAARIDPMLSSMMRGGRLDPDHRICHLVAGELVVGHLWFSRTDDPTVWYGWDLAVKPSYRGLGYGREALLVAEGMVRSEGAESVELAVLTTNDVARSPYRSLGFLEQPAEPGPMVRMRRPIEL